MPNCPNFAWVFGDDFRVVDTFGRGSCFFHSLANALCEGYDWEQDTRKREALGIKLRHSFAKYSNEQLYKEAMDNVLSRLKKMRKTFGSRVPANPEVPSYRTFRDKMEKTSIWADLVLISYVAQIFNLNLLFWDESSCGFYFGVDSFNLVDAGIPTIFVNWRNHTHFELILRIDKQKNRIERQFFADKHPALLKRVRDEYFGTTQPPRELLI